jgi:general secretion pathway protein D
VDLNINSVSSYVNLGGISQPVISQKKISHDIRMREGEVGLLGGLINVQDTKTVTGIPGLSSIPLIKHLFSGDSIERDRNELMIVLIPHVIRRPEITPENLRAIAVGNFATVKVNYAPKPVEPSAAAPPGPGGTPAPPATAPPATAPPATAPPGPGGTPAPPATAPPAATAPQGPGGAPSPLAAVLGQRGIPAPPATAPPLPGPGSTPAPAAGTRVYFAPSQTTLSPPERITISLLIEGGADVASAPMQIQFDPKLLRLNDVSLGDFFSKDDRPPVFTKNIMNDTGAAIIQLNRPPGSHGAGRSGTLVTLTFEAVARGTAVVQIPHLAVRNAQGAIISNSTPQLTVTVK